MTPSVGASDKGRSRQAAASGLIDQAFSSASNVLMVLAVARVTAPEIFGIFALAYVGTTVCLAAVRGAFGTPISLRAHSPAHVHLEVRWALRKVAAVVLPISLIGIPALAWGSAAVSAAGALALTLPILLVQDLLRFASLALGRGWTTALADGLWTLVSAGLLVSTWLFGSWISAPWVVLIWGAGGVMSLSLLAVRALRTSDAQEPTDAPSTEVTVGDRGRLGFDASMGAWVALVVTGVVAWLLDPLAAAALRGAGTMLGPINVLISSLQAVFVPMMVRRPGASVEQLLGVAKPVIVSVAALSVTVSAAGLLLPPELGELLLGATWTAAAPVLAVLGVEFLGHALLAPLLTILRAKNMSQLLLKIRVGMGIGQAVAGILAAYLLGSAVAVAAANVLVVWVTAPLVLRVVHRKWRRNRHTVLIGESS